MRNDEDKVIKMSVLLSYLIYRFNAITIKISASCFVDINELILKLIHKSKRPRIANTVLKENKIEVTDTI